MDDPEYLGPLNAEQRRAVLHGGLPGAPPLLILAGAGSGKTRVITTKIAYLIRERGVAPESILAVTFTNKAAREMAARACGIDGRAERAMLRTFHSFGAWFLRRNGALIGLDANFVIYDDDDMVTLLGTIIPDTPRAELSHTAHLIARAKDYFLTPEDPALDLIDHRPEFRRRYRLYEERLARIGNTDFGDLIKKPVEILRRFPEVRDRFRQRFRVILVDEYQDSNVAQFELLKELWDPQTYLCVVGDDDQSIYRFRGAEVRNILEFPDRFAGTDIIRLERNYRSTAPILAVAGAVVDRNRGRLGKTLRSERGAGKTPTLAFLPDQDAEVSFCAELIQRSVASGAGYAEWAILYRMNAQSLGFETEFLRRKIPYRVVGSLKFYEREEVKDALALLAFTVNPRDEVAFRRVVNKPTRGVGAATVDRITAGAGDSGDLEAAAAALAPQLGAKARAGLTLFLDAVAAARDLLDREVAMEGGADDAPAVGKAADGSAGVSAKRKKSAGKAGADSLVAGEGLSVCVVALVAGTGLADHHAAQDEIAGTQRLANLQELANAASLYAAGRQGLAEFLEHIELDRAMERAEDASDAVTLITVHNTKGLEFRRVIMTGLEQGIFPRDDKKDEDLEEERRLFYVGATRAMDELYLSSCAQRRMYGRTLPSAPSPFLGEIPADALRVLGRGARGGGFAPRGGPAAAERDKPVRRLSSDGRWELGSRLYHDDYGYGAVALIRETEDGPVVHARFENGREVKFLSKYQSSRFMRIGNDE